MSDTDAVAVALSAAMDRDDEDVFGVLLNAQHSKKASTLKTKLAITDDEFCLLFGHTSVILRSEKLISTSEDPVFKQHESSILEALRCSLEEHDSKKAWNRAGTRLACYYALHTDNTDERIAMCLGGFVRADSRRIDDVRSCVEDDGADTLLLCRTLISLAEAVA